MLAAADWGLHRPGASGDISDGTTARTVHGGCANANASKATVTRHTSLAGQIAKDDKETWCGCKFAALDTETDGWMDAAHLDRETRLGWELWVGGMHT